MRRLLVTLVSLAAPLTGVATAAAETVASVPSGIADDCSEPVDAEINAFVASVPDGSTVRFPSGGCYGYDGTLLVRDRNNVVVDGGGSTFRALTPGDIRRSSWRVLGGSGITLRNMTVVGANPERTYHRQNEYQHGTDFRGTQGGAADNVTVTDTLGDGLYVGHDMRKDIYTAPPARDIRVTGSTFDGIGRMGIGFVNVDGAVVESSHFDHVALSAIDVEPDVAEEWARDIRISGNTFGAVHHAIFTDGGKGGGARRGSIVFEDNTQLSVATTCVPPILVAAPSDLRRANYTFRNNTLNTRSVGVRITRANDVVIDGNRFEWRSAGCSISAGVQLTSAKRVAVTSNAFAGFSTMILRSQSTYTAKGNTLGPLSA